MSLHLVTISYLQRGAKPPIFVAGNFTTPGWQALELDYVEMKGDFEFFKDLYVPPGKYQYKFRKGHGNWWMCDESQPKGQ